MEEQKQDSDTSHYCEPSSSEIHNHSTGELYVNSVEGGAEINCEVNIILTPEIDDNNEINDVLDESMDTYHRRKRRKSTELSDLPTSDLGFLRQDACSSSLSMDQRVRNTSVDQSVEFESVPPCCSENISDKRVIAEDKVSAEVDEKKSLEKDLACSLGSEKTCSGNNDGLIGELDETSKNHNVDMLGGMDLKELHNEANDELRILDIREENIGNGPSLPSDGDPPMYHEEQCVASEADLSLELLDDSKGVPADRTSTGYKVKKLLVLDVNGLLVHICPYIPYNYNPDDIIMKKAIFKRPHCDDFLKFCFENFNVGIWTSRTKSNIEPILEFLLGNDKRKLLFCWDQSHCTNTGFTTVEKRHKPLLLKKLKKLWDKYDPDLPAITTFQRCWRQFIRALRRVLVQHNKVHTELEIMDP